jgi:hypothetical protein
VSATRYFKATDGRVTVFRATSRVGYRYARFTTQELTRGPTPIGDIVFSLGTTGGGFPAIEIDAVEYQALRAAKIDRQHRDCPGVGGFTKSPRASWVRNVDLGGAP